MGIGDGFHLALANEEVDAHRDLDLLFFVIIPCCDVEERRFSIEQQVVEQEEVSLLRHLPAQLCQLSFMDQHSMRLCDVALIEK